MRTEATFIDATFSYVWKGNVSETPEPIPRLPEPLGRIAPLSSEDVPVTVMVPVFMLFVVSRYATVALPPPTVKDDPPTEKALFWNVTLAMWITFVENVMPFPAPLKANRSALVPLDAFQVNAVVTVERFTPVWGTETTFSGNELCPFPESVTPVTT